MQFLASSSMVLSESLTAARSCTNPSDDSCITPNVAKDGLKPFWSNHSESPTQLHLHFDRITEYTDRRPIR